jgi:predicted aconitase
LVIEAYARMGVVTTCSCTPYLSGNLPLYGESIAWAESSAVCFANSVLGAHTNREGGPSALAAAMTGKTPRYGMHLPENRQPTITVHVEAHLNDQHDFAALGIVLGKWIESKKVKSIPFIQGIPSASLEQLKSFCASIATYGGLALYHMDGITPECGLYDIPSKSITIRQADVDEAIHNLNASIPSGEVDFVSLGCPHLSLAEIARIAERLNGKHVTKTFWITTARPTKHLADQLGYSAQIEAAGAVFAVDTCCVVAPIKGRFNAIATDSAKACYYAAAKNGFKTRFLAFDDVIEEALK